MTRRAIGNKSLASVPIPVPSPVYHSTVAKMSQPDNGREDGSGDRITFGELGDQDEPMDALGRRRARECQLGSSFQTSYQPRKTNC
jgi:hypothetical protein